MTLGEGSIAQDIFLPNRAAKAGVSEDAMRQSPFDSEERTFRTRVRHVPRETTMNDQWEYQIRVYLEDEFAEVRWSHFVGQFGSQVKVYSVV